MKRFLAIVVFLILTPFALRGQSFNEYKERASKEFSAFKEKSRQDFSAYRNRKQAEMEDYIRQTWEKFYGNNPLKTPVKEDKDLPPVVMPEEDRGSLPEDRPVPVVDVIPPLPPCPDPQPLSPIEEVPAVVPSLTVDLYGTPCKVRFDASAGPRLASGAEEDVASMWMTLCGQDYLNLYFDCQHIRETMGLCDWAYVGLTEAISEAAYGKSNESTVLQAVILIQSGFRVLLSRDEDGRFHTLMATDADVYERPFWIIGGVKYYLFDDTHPKSLYTMAKTHPELQPIRLYISGRNAFASSPSAPRTLSSRDNPQIIAKVSTNTNLIQFYSTYPESFANNDHFSRWRFYAMASLSDNAREGLYPSLQEAIMGKSQLEAANLLLNFVQTAFKYEYDDKVWGRDRAFFPDETLYYPYSDCEDRSILFSRLVRDLLKLDVVLVFYPGHLYTAVQFTENVSGDYLTLDGFKYVVCDPTYIHAPVGKTMPGMNNAEAVAIKL